MRTHQISRYPFALLTLGTVAALVAMTLHSVGSNAASQPASVLNGSMRYSAAVQQLGEQRLMDLNPAISESRSVELKADATSWVDKTGRVFFVEPLKDSEASQLAASAASGTTSAAEVSSAALSDAFNLESKQGSSRTIYLDFDGITGIANTGWNGSANFGTPAGSFDAVPYDIDGDATSFSDAERELIISVWQRVSEDYAPFDVNVTTKDLGYAAINRSSSSDLTFGSTLAITSMTDMIAANCNCGGIAYVDVFDHTSLHDYYQPAWVFAANMPDGNAKDIAEAATHELGHNLGLSHDGRTLTPSEGYYAGAGVWAPIMGVGYYRPMVQWSKGEYPLANNAEDDLSIILSSGLNLVADDYADNAASATALPFGEFGKSGVISTRTDLDVFKFASTGGDFSVSAAVAGVSPNLDLKLELKDSNGAVVALDNPDTVASGSDEDTGIAGLGASISATLVAGSYSLWVDGVGSGDLSTGYSDYASLGAYTLSGFVPGSRIPTPPTVTGFNVSSASLGGQVVISGTYLSATTEVAVNGVAATFTGVTDSQLTLTVPVGATTGPVSVTTPDGTSESSTNLIVLQGPVSGPVPTITASNDSFKVGQALTAEAGSWTPNSTALTYQWNRDGSVIAGATDATRILTNSDAGHKLTVKVSGSASEYTSASRVSSETAVITGGTLESSYVPQISGDYVVGSTLTGTAFSSTPAADSVSYSWFAVLNETETLLQSSANRTLVIPSSALGSQIKLKAVAVRLGFDQLAISSVPNGSIVAGGSITRGTPTVSGTWQVGRTLTASTGKWTPSATTFTYQWLRNAEAIVGATNSSYTLIGADYSSSISVRVTGSLVGSASVSATSAAKAVTAKGSFSAKTASVTGTTSVGNSLGLSFNPSPSCDALVVIWRADGATIQTGAATTYLLTLAEAGKKIDAKLTCSGFGYNDLQQTTGTTQTITGGTFTKTNPVITGTAVVGQKLQATTGTWSPTPESLTFAWTRDGVVQGGQRSSTYWLTSSDIGHSIQVSVTAAKKGFTSTVANSVAVGPVTGGQIKIMNPAIYGTAIVGRTLATSSWTSPGGGVMTYVWMRNGVAIPSATSSTYLLVAADRGTTISLRFSVSKPFFESTSQTVTVNGKVK